MKVKELLMILQGALKEGLLSPEDDLVVLGTGDKRSRQGDLERHILELREQRSKLQEEINTLYWEDKYPIGSKVSYMHGKQRRNAEVVSYLYTGIRVRPILGSGKLGVVRTLWKECILKDKEGET